MEWLRQQVSVGSMIMVLGIIVAGWLIRSYVVPWLSEFILKRLSSRKLGYNFLKAFTRPIGAVLFYTSIYISLHYLIENTWLYWSIIHHIYRSVLVMVVGIGAYGMCRASSEFIEELAISMGIDRNSIVLPLLSRISRVIVLILTITVLIAEWGYSINGVVAGLGLGSVAIALAAKDTVSDILAGIIIITEKPFAKGDWILTPSVEGFVEDITFRSSRIRTFADALVTVPNHMLVDQPITNWSKMGRRRITYHIQVALDTDLEKLELAMSRMEQYLFQREDIDERLIMVRFNEIKDDSLSVFLYYFSKTVIWKDHLLVRQQTMIKMIEILREEGILLAYPVSRILLDHNTEKEALITRSKETLK